MMPSATFNAVALCAPTFISGAKSAVRSVR
jgi:hypothetical protein